MEHFFIDDKFYSEIEDLISELEDDFGENLVDMPDDFSIQGYEGKLEPIVQLSENWIIDRISDERFPEEDNERTYDQVYSILSTINFEELNKKFPSLYYGTRNKFTLTKEDLLEYL